MIDSGTIIRYSLILALNQLLEQKKLTDKHGSSRERKKADLREKKSRI